MCPQRLNCAAHPPSSNGCIEMQITSWAVICVSLVFGNRLFEIIIFIFFLVLALGKCQKGPELIQSSGKQMHQYELNTIQAHKFKFLYQSDITQSSVRMRSWWALRLATGVTESMASFWRLHYIRGEAGRIRREHNKSIKKERWAEESKCLVENYLLGSVGKEQIFLYSQGSCGLSSN